MKKNLSLAIMKMLRQYNVIVSNTHVVFSSGQHGSVYINKDALYPHTLDVSFLCLEFANKFIEDDPDIVVAPATAGIALSSWTAYHLTIIGEKKKDVLAIYIENEKDNSLFIKRENAILLPNKKVLIVEDITTTGRSLLQYIKLIQELGGEVVGVATLYNRNTVTAKQLGVRKYFSHVTLQLDSWEPKECPQCKEGVPIDTRFGHG